MSSAARIGIGNLAGVKISYIYGGPGAVFWMWVIAIIGASSSFVESTLAQIYKVKRWQWLPWWSCLLYGKRFK